MNEFVHLHVHSEFSMLDGAIRLKELAQRVKELGQPAVALTDHNNMHGMLQFASACEAVGVKPLIGCELQVVRGRVAEGKDRHGSHLSFIAEGAEGYRSLTRLVSGAWTSAQGATSPQVDLEMIHANRKGLMCLSGCLGGWVPQTVMTLGEEAGGELVGRLRDALEPGNLYLEMQDHGFPEQAAVNEIVADLAGKFDLKLVATNDCHYLAPGDARPQLVLQCIGAGRTLVEMERAHHGSREMYVKSTDEMLDRFRLWPSAITSTLEIAERGATAAAALRNRPKLPSFPVPHGGTEAEYLYDQSMKGLHRRIDETRAAIGGREIDKDQYEARLRFELETIVSMGFPGYFLIVADFINWAKEQKIPVGPGRGSGAGSLVAYSLRITDLDPIFHGLLFERFLNPERVSMPDFDVDFCMDRRDEVINYVKAKYGDQSVGQIATFHQLKSRSVVKDVGRSLGMPLVETAKIASMIPEPVQGKTVPIAKAMEQEARLKALYGESKEIRDLLDTAMSLEDLNRHAGMHAAGVVISEGPLWDHVPVFCPEPGIYVTQYHKDDVETAGLVKFDFLGLKTLTVIELAVALINKRPDRSASPLSIEHIPVDDRATFGLLQSGDTTNVFQLESQGMQTLFKKLKPDTFEDIVAAVALYRPGPLGSGMVDDFVQRKHRRVKVTYPDPCLEPVLKDTYGVIVYQEQVMEIARTMAGYTLGGADLLRRAMGKKKAEEMAKQRASFVQGSLSRGHSEEKAGQVFDLVDYFAGYGFNKSHSAAYALITYQTAYLKAHYPVEFTCATLSADKDKIDKVVRTVAEARQMGITVLPPDVNESSIDFTVVYGKPDRAERAAIVRPVSSGGVLRDQAEPKIRFGLGGIKGVGEAALEAVLEVRRNSRFIDVFDFASRVDLRRVNKGVFESLIQSGAFDSVHGTQNVHRAQAFAAIEVALDRGKRASSDREAGQTDLFGLLGGDDAVSSSMSAFPTIPSWDSRELLAREKNALGFYVSGHPLSRYRDELSRFGNASTGTLEGRSDGSDIRIGGTVEGYRERPTRSGGRIGFFDLEDDEGRVEVIVRDRVLDDARPVLTAGDPIYLEADLRYESTEDGTEPSPRLILKAARSLPAAIAERAKGIRVQLNLASLQIAQVKSLRALLDSFPGRCPVGLEIASDESWSIRVLDTGLRVEPSDTLMFATERMFGRKILKLT